MTWSTKTTSKYLLHLATFTHFQGDTWATFFEVVSESKRDFTWGREEEEMEVVKEWPDLDQTGGKDRRNKENIEIVEENSEICGVPLSRNMKESFQNSSPRLPAARLGPAWKQGSGHLEMTGRCEVDILAGRGRRKSDQSLQFQWYGRRFSELNDCCALYLSLRSS